MEMNHPVLETEKRGVSKFMLGLIGQPLKQAKSETNQRLKNGIGPYHTKGSKEKSTIFFTFFSSLLRGIFFATSTNWKRKKWGSLPIPTYFRLLMKYHWRDGIKRSSIEHT
jgi:hypothetical protein